LQRLGIYGGTFDPIHEGHLYLIEQVISRNIVDRLLVVPAGEPQLREHAPLASGADRKAMCIEALKDLPAEVASKVEVNSIEILRIGPSYTIDTVEAAIQSFPNYRIILIMGSDAYKKVNEWHRADDLKKLVEFVVIDRPHHPGDSTHEIDALDVSSTEVRSGQSQAVSPSVAAYIKEHNLYASK
jgi:nicotinate-nucleotide adenylyltransferase